MEIAVPKLYLLPVVCSAAFLCSSASAQRVQALDNGWMITYDAGPYSCEISKRADQGGMRWQSFRARMDV
jgi:hypothetical protein